MSFSYSNSHKTYSIVPARIHVKHLLTILLSFVFSHIASKDVALLTCEGVMSTIGLVYTNPRVTVEIMRPYNVLCVLHDYLVHVKLPCGDLVLLYFSVA